MKHDHEANLQGWAQGATHTFLYLPSKSNVNVCLHFFVHSSSLNWIEIMLFQIYKTQAENYYFYLVNE